MKGRVTREHDARQDYRGVYWEGGGAITDADVNAAFDANRAADEALTRVWIAPAGSADGGWLASGLRRRAVAGTDMVDFDLGAGHYTLDGEVLRNPDAYSFGDQPHALAAALEPDMALEWPTAEEITEAGGERFDAVVLDSRQMAVTVVEDSELDEVAIRSDPATRVRPSPKVRILRQVGATCAVARPEAMARLAGDCGEIALPSPAIRSRGRLRVHLGDVAQPDNPCAPEQATGYFGRLNHTIQVMLTAPDRFVWAYRNAGELYRATLDDNATLRIVTPFDDKSRRPVSGQIAEILTWDSRLPNGEVTAAPLGRFHAIREGYSPAEETIELDSPLDADFRSWYDAAGEGAFLFVRFWEPPALAMATSTGTGADVAVAETGVRLHFVEPGCAGDRWTFSVRANANDTVFPKRMLEPGGQPPGEPRRAADLIALIRWELDGDDVVGHLHDCRRRIRPLWKLRGCSTLTVGDGSSSFGDVDRLEDAIAMVPPEGGRIRLMPGLHVGGVTLRDRKDLTIEGCRGQTRVVRGEGVAPILRIEDCTDVTLRDFTIEDGRGLAVAAARTVRLSLERIDTVGHGSAISLVGGTGTRVRHCDFLAEAEPEIIPAEDYSALRPLAFVGGRGIEVSDSLFRCGAERLTLMSLGGLQIASASRDVRIARCAFLCGVGHGITLGHQNRISVVGIRYAEAELVAELGEAVMAGVEEQATWTRNSREATLKGSYILDVAGPVSEGVEEAREMIAGAQIGFAENPIGITQVATQGCLGVDPTLTVPEPEPEDEDWETYVPAGAVTNIHILDNEIVGMGGSGLSVPSWNLALRLTAGETLVEALVAERNHISDCARVAVATSLDDDDLQEIGFGGIALQVVRGVRLGSNVIQNIGQSHRSPSVGIYFAEAQTCHIHDNQILGIGRTERRGNRNILGVSGGIVVDGALPVYGAPVVGGGETVDVVAGIDDLLAHSAGTVGADVAVGYLVRSAKEATKKVADVGLAARAIATQVALPRTEALRIQNNQVSVAFGPSLDVRGTGSFHVADNHLTTLLVRTNPARPRLGNGVSVVNTELPNIESMVTSLVLIRLILRDFGNNGAINYREVASHYQQVLMGAAAGLLRQRDPSVIQVQNNHIRTETFVRTDNDPIALVAVVSPFDVQISDNVLKSAHSDRSAWVHLLGTGALSLQCVSNRIDTRPSEGVLYAAMTAGRDNTTFLNHASQSLVQVRVTTAVPAGPGNIHT